MSQVKSTKGYILESVIINSSRMLEPFDISGIVSDIEIFEHLDLPYLTGQIAMVDTFRLYDRLDFQGAEYCTIKIKQTEKSETIEKRFVIDKLLSNKKANEQTDLIMFHIIEDVLFKSNIQNVNRAYKGIPKKIISDISKEWLDKKVEDYSGSILQKSMKVIVPNMTPLSAIKWIKNRTTTESGFPTYLFSSFTIPELIHHNLYDLISGQPINKTSPFIFGVSNHDMEILDFKHVPIKEYSIANTENLYNLVADGLVGAEHQYIDTHTGKQKKYKFDVTKDAFSKILEGNLANKEPAFSSDFEFDDKRLQAYTSRKLVQVSESGAYDDATNRYRSYNEETDASDHSKKIVAQALKSFLLKSPITIRIDGAGFIQKDKHYTTGNIVRILFLANRPMNLGDVKLDLKKSGDYLVYSAKHSFGGSRYHIHLTCVKLTNYTDDNPLKVIG